MLLFGLANVFFIFMFLQVLGPAVAQERLGGAGAWAAILTAAGIGAIAGGVAALRQHPRRPLDASYDAFGSFVLSRWAPRSPGRALSPSAPLGAVARRRRAPGRNLTMLLIPAVWRIEARQPQGAWQDRRHEPRQRLIALEHEGWDALGSGEGGRYYRERLTTTR